MDIEVQKVESMFILSTYSYIYSASEQTAISRVGNYVLFYFWLWI